MFLLGVLLLLVVHQVSTVSSTDAGIANLDTKAAGQRRGDNATIPELPFKKCDCKKTGCSCCLDAPLPFFNKRLGACVDLTFDINTTTLELKVTVASKILYSKEFTELDLPEICLSGAIPLPIEIPIIGSPEFTNFCIKVHNLDLTSELGLSGCIRYIMTVFGKEKDDEKCFEIKNKKYKLKDKLKQRFLKPNQIVRS